MNNRLLPPKIKIDVTDSTSSRQPQLDQTTSNDRLNKKKEIRGEMIAINCYRILPTERLSPMVDSNHLVEIPTIHGETMAKTRDKVVIVAAKSGTKSFPKCDAISVVQVSSDNQIDECPAPTCCSSSPDVVCLAAGLQ